MNNLTAREKGFMYVITLLIIVVLGYFFGIRTLNNKYDEYKVQLQELTDRKAYLDQLKLNNANMSTEIKELGEKCEKIELTFIDELETDCIEQYVLSVFEEENCPFLVSINSEDVGMSPVQYPDGSASPDGVVCMRISVQYSSTDGYTVTQYNRTPDFTSGSEVSLEDQLNDLSAKMGKEEYAERRGYNEFISALKKINAEDPNCIKVDSITVADDNGAMKLTATISFYGTNLQNRLSTDNSKKAYTYWRGEENVPTDGGFIGFPYICDNEKSLWFGIQNANIDQTATKPFAAYWAESLFKKQYDDNGRDYYKLLGFEDRVKAKNEADKATADANNGQNSNADNAENAPA